MTLLSGYFNHAMRSMTGAGCSVSSVAVIAMLAMSACTAPAADEGVSEAVQGLTGPKQCQAFINNSWGPANSVDDTETLTGCRQWVNDTYETTAFRVGCQFANSDSWGGLGAVDQTDLPNPNCGWECVPNYGQSCATSLVCNCGGGHHSNATGWIDCSGPCRASCIDACNL